MSEIAIRVENLSKRYKIGVFKGRHDTLRDHLLDGFRHLFSRNGRNAAVNTGCGNAAEITSADSFWALKDVSFDVKHGEVVGLIGRNGAGKSTLLKILSRITRPTEGRADIEGRVGSLLEVGTGFHPELTGRENIFLNGAIIGMRRTEIQRKFDEIVSFAEIEKFIDTPVKRYSSGMYVRLAFAVAAHLEPEIMLVDEVLAVGDAAFQKKCLERIQTLTASGTTTLVVSHSMASIQNLCKRALWLEAAELSFDGKSFEAANLFIDYMNRMARSTAGNYLDTATRRGTGEVCFTELAISNSTGQRCAEFQMGEDIRIRAKYQAYKEVCAPDILIIIRDVETGVFITSIRKRGLIPALRAGQKGMVECVLESIRLRPRRYALKLIITSRDSRRLSYDVWDGIGPDITIVPDPGAVDAECILPQDPALVSVSHRVTHVLDTL